MNLNTGFRFENTFRLLPRKLFEEVKQTPISDPQLIHTTELKHSLGIPTTRSLSLLIGNDKVRRETIERSVRMKKTNPKYVLKNYIAQEVIQEVEQGGSKRLNQWLIILSHPFDEHPDFESYSGPTPPQYKQIEVSCSS